MIISLSSRASVQPKPTEKKEKKNPASKIVIQTIYFVGRLVKFVYAKKSHWLEIIINEIPVFF